MSHPVAGATASRVFEVAESDTALVVGSGRLPVLATPRLLAWMEQVAVSVVDPTLPTGHTSVGTHVEFDHVAAVRVGARVTVRAEVATVEGRRFGLTARATDSAGVVLAMARMTRVAVDGEPFLARLV
ncbi:MAG: thioesterase [Geodermatophilaceae bacterium]|nr:thioesterase [Geodermatophilaceae bacterium]